MSEETSSLTTQTESTVESIPIPPSPKALKSSDEILSELFEAFNAKPPPLNDLVLQDDETSLSDKSHKKHKKHNKKKQKKAKKKKRSSSSESYSSKGSKKKSCKKHKKHSSKHSDSEPVTSRRKKKRKLGKYSESDPDSDGIEPTSKKRKSATEVNHKSIKELPKVKIKQERDSNLTKISEVPMVSTAPVVIREIILKEAVSKIVDKVIRSTDLCTEIPKNSHVNSDSNNQDSNKVSSEILFKPVKQEIDNIVHESNKSTEKYNELNLVKQNNKELDQTFENSNKNLVPSKLLPVADVFVEDLIDCQNKKDEVKPNLDNQKQPGSKIKMPNLKFSQVYEATVKQIEEEAKLKAEKYEEGEISETSEEEERSPTPSDISCSGSIKENHEDQQVEKKRHRHRHRHKHRHHSSHHRSKYRSKSHDKVRSHSQSERSRSGHRHTRDRHKDEERSKERVRSLERGRSRDCQRSTDRTKERLRSRSRSKDYPRSRARSRSRDRTKEKVRSKAKSRSEERRSKDRDRSRDRRRRHGRSHSRDRSPEEKIDKQKLLEIARKNALNMLKNPPAGVDQTKLAITSGGKTVNELTDFCKLLSKKDADGHESISSNTDNSSDSETEKPFHHPFQIKDRPSGIILNIRNSVALPVKSLQEKAAEQSRQLRLQFPVSSGQHHRKTESEWVPVSPKRIEAPPVAPTLAVTPVVKPPTTPNLDIGSIVSQRLDAIRKLQENPTDSEALTQMQAAQKYMQHWAESKQQPPGQFTGTTGVKVLSQAELASGYQAWARRDQLQAAAPVQSGLGMTLLQKMGWRPGEGLGKNKEGTLQPLLLEVKMDKKGLVAQEELPVRQPHQIIRGKPRSLEGKHPVSLLNEYCSRRKLGPPYFELVDEAGPDHKKNFLYKVRVNGVEYKPAVGSPKKKQARAEAAEVCLKALGILSAK